MKVVFIGKTAPFDQSSSNQPGHLHFLTVKKISWSAKTGRAWPGTLIFPLLSGHLWQLFSGYDNRLQRHHPDHFNKIGAFP